MPPWPIRSMIRYRPVEDGIHERAHSDAVLRVADRCQGNRPLDPGRHAGARGCRAPDGDADNVAVVDRDENPRGIAAVRERARTARGAVADRVSGSPTTRGKL